jgi:hypothetical protein
VASAARLRAAVYGIPVGAEVDDGYVKKVLGDVIVPDFSPQVSFHLLFI